VRRFRIHVQTLVLTILWERGGRGGEGFRNQKKNRGRSKDNGKGAHHSDEWVVPETYREYRTFELEPGDEGDPEGRTCLAKDGEFTLLPASLVDVSLRRHYDLELMENRKERWKELIMHSGRCTK
jgi:hypothetical protein